MTAGTKAILLLSVLGLIVLVAWYGDGPTGGSYEQAGSYEPSRASDPLLAAASGNTASRQPVRSTPPPAPAREEASDVLSQGGAGRPVERQPAGPGALSSPPTLAMGEALGGSVRSGWEQSKWDEIQAKIRSRSAVGSQGRSSDTSGREVARSTAAADTRPSSSKPVAQQAHKVRPGDTLGHLAQRYYGAASRWNLIANANPGIDPGSLRVGDELVIPAAPARTASATTRRTVDLPPLPTGRTHTIGEGETLSSIADDHLGHEKHWYRIYELNEQRIGSNPDRLVLGMVIALPR